MEDSGVEVDEEAASIRDPGVIKLSCLETTPLCGGSGGLGDHQEALRDA